MKKLAIIGSGDLANQIAKHAMNDNHYQPVGFFDDFEMLSISHVPSKSQGYVEKVGGYHIILIGTLNPPNASP